MSKQLIYSTVGEGIDGGRDCFCYAAGSPGAFNNRLVLQNLLPVNSFQQIYTYSDNGADANPVNFCHFRVSAGASDVSVLSRICAAALYGGRSNFFAHHLLLDEQEQIPAGPAQFLLNFPFKKKWDNQSQLAIPTAPGARNETAGLAQAWKNLQVDPGWAGWLADKFLASSVVHLLYPRHINPLPLIQDALLQLQPHQRWKVGFSTYYTLAGNGPKCHWRFIPLEASQFAAPFLSKTPAELTLNLSQPLPRANDSLLVKQARGEKEELAPLIKRDPRPAPFPEKVLAPILLPGLPLLPGLGNIPSRAPGVHNPNWQKTENPFQPSSFSPVFFVKILVLILTFLLPVGLAALASYSQTEKDAANQTTELNISKKDLDEEKDKGEKALKAVDKKLAEEKKTEELEGKTLAKLQGDLEREKNKILPPQDFTTFDALKAPDWVKLNKEQIKMFQDLLNESKKIKERKIEIAKVELKGPEDLEKHQGKIITDSKTLAAKIEEWANKKAVDEKPGAKEKRAKVKLDSDKVAFEAKKELEEFFKKAKDSKFIKNPPPTTLLFNLVYLNLLEEIAQENLYAFQFLHESKHLQDGLGAQKKHFTPDILKGLFEKVKDNEYKNPALRKILLIVFTPGALFRFLSEDKTTGMVGEKIQGDIKALEDACPKKGQAFLEDFQKYAKEKKMEGEEAAFILGALLDFTLGKPAFSQRK